MILDGPDATELLIAPLADGEAVHFLDINAVFTQADGSLSPEVLPDQLHLSKLGCRLPAQAMPPPWTACSRHRLSNLPPPCIP